MWADSLYQHLLLATPHRLVMYLLVSESSLIESLVRSTPTSDICSVLRQCYRLIIPPTIAYTQLYPYTLAITTNLQFHKTSHLLMVSADSSSGILLFQCSLIQLFSITILIDDVLKFTQL